MWKKEWVQVLFLVIIFIAIRSINFVQVLNFSHDQAWFSNEALEILKNKKLTLIGPHISWMYEGRKIFQGSVSYYFQLFFLVLGKLDPIKSSYLFMLFNSLMIIPLYFGTKLLINKKAAYLMVVIFALLPYFIDYSRFFWNPNFQFSLVPLLIFLMGLFKKTNRKIYLFLIGLFSGILVQFHYQFIIIILALTAYYFVLLKTSLKIFPLYTLSLILGFSPIIVFELRNNFYNLNTLVLYLGNQNQVITGSSIKFTENSHYWLSITLFTLLIFLGILRNKITYFSISIIFLTFLTSSLVLYVPKPAQGFRMSKNWNYLNEYKAYQFIRNENLTNYNVVNLVYNTKAEVQRYLHRKDNLNLDFDNYKDNKYLFVIGKNDQSFWEDQAYEVKYFRPAKLLKTWQINEYYNLYLLLKTE